MTDHTGKSQCWSLDLGLIIIVSKELHALGVGVRDGKVGYLVCMEGLALGHQINVSRPAHHKRDSVDPNKQLS